MIARRPRGAIIGGTVAAVVIGIGTGPAAVAARQVTLESHPERSSPVSADPRIRYLLYDADRVYSLRGYAGYEIDLQFAPGERFEGLGVGDAKAIKVAATANHLFIKPAGARVSTDITVLTNRRTYVFSYRVRPTTTAHRATIIYAVRFEYPHALHRSTAVQRQRLRVDRDLYRAEHAPPRNENYWYCGPRELKPEAAWDDGVQTHLIFPSREQLPAVFARNADGSESLVNFDMRGNQMVIHRIARRFVLKRGRLTGCIVNKGFTGSGRRLASGTLSSRVWRVTRRAARSRTGSAGTGGTR